MICKCFFPFVSHLFTLWIVSFDTQKLGARACCRMLMLSHFSCVWLCATLWTAACQVPLSMEFSRHEYWVGCHAFLQGIFLTQGSNPCLLYLLHWQAGSLPLAPHGKPRVGVGILYFEKLPRWIWGAAKPGYLDRLLFSIIKPSKDLQGQAWELMNIPLFAGWLPGKFYEGSWH